MSFRPFYSPRRAVDVDVDADADGTPTQSPDAQKAPKARAATGASVMPGLVALSLDSLNSRAAPTMAVEPYTRTAKMPPDQVSAVMARIVKKINNWRDDPRAGNHWERKLIKGGRDQIPVHELSWLRTDKVAGKLPAELGGDTPGDDDDTESDKDKQVKAQNAVNIIVSAFWTQGFLQQLITTGERYAVRITANKLAELEKAQGKDATGAPAPEYTTSALDIFTAIFERDLARTEAVRHEEQEAAQQKAARDKVSQGALAQQQRSEYLWAMFERDDLEAARQARRDAMAAEVAERKKKDRKDAAARGAATKKFRREMTQFNEEEAHARDTDDWLPDSKRPERAPPAPPRQTAPRPGSPLESSDDDFDKPLPYGGYAPDSHPGLNWRIKDAEERLRAARKAPRGASEQDQREAEEAIAEIEKDIEDLKAKLLALNERQSR